MANKTTVALTKEQYTQIIDTMRKGGPAFRKNDRIATALVLEANLGIRIQDILNLRLCDIIKDGERYRLNIVEQKTKKKRRFTVPDPIYKYIEDYAREKNIRSNEKLFAIKEREVQRYLQVVTEYLSYDNVGTHSFRKFYATDIYYSNNQDIVLVQTLLQHSSVKTTQRYIGISSQKQEEAILGHMALR